MIRLAVLLCKGRHAQRVTAYESGGSVERVEAVLREHAPKSCHECSSRTFTLEHSDTGFKTLAEAGPHVMRLNGVKRWSATPEPSSTR